MNVSEDHDTARLLRTAAWMWLGYLAALLAIDGWLYQRLGPMSLYYSINFSAALVFLLLAYWNGPRLWLGKVRLPLMLLILSILPLVGNHLLLPRLPQGPLSNAEGMALRQLPVLFVALVITAWQYRLPGVILFSGGTAILELATVVVLVPLVVFVTRPGPFSPPERFIPVPLQAVNVFLILALIRTVSFVAVGIFVSQLISRLRSQQKSLEDANARLTHYASTLESLTISRERNRLAHELHDTLAHSLTAISVQLETVKAYWSVDRRKARQQLERSLAATRSGVEETRRALKSLRAAPLEELGLILAIRNLAESAAARAGAKLALTLPDSLPALSPDVEQCLYRITQEALENAVAHAGPQTLTVCLDQNGPGLSLFVQDDGTGFDPARAEETGHFGLVGMRERARLVGGQLLLDSQPDRGTTVRLEIGGAL